LLKKAIISIAVASSLLLAPHTASAAPKHKTVVHHHTVVVAKPALSAVTIAAWQRVAQCEEGGNWKYFSYWYPNGLGIDRPNWIQFGGSLVKPSSMIEQIKVAQRFIKYYGMVVPDQYGCHSW